MLATAHAEDKRVFVWTLNERNLLNQYLARGVDGIITDQVSLAVRLRSEIAERTPAQTFLVEAAQIVLP